MMNPLAKAPDALIRAALGGLALATVAAGTALADQAPQINPSGPLYNTFVEVRPYIALILFAYGVYAIFHYAYHITRARMHKVANGALEADGETLALPSLSGFLTHIVFVVGMVAILMAVMFAGLDVFNALLKFVWSIASGSTLST